jgi:hypothetical protein
MTALAIAALLTGLAVAALAIAALLTGLTIAALAGAALPALVALLPGLALTILTLAVLAVPLALGFRLLRAATLLVTSIHRFTLSANGFKPHFSCCQRHAVAPVPVLFWPYFPG